MQAVGDDADEVGRQVGNALAVLLGELPDGLVLLILRVCIIRFVEPQNAVLLGLDHRVALVDGEVERSREVGIAPGLSLFYLEVHIAVAWQGYDDDGHRDNDQCGANQEIAPTQGVRLLQSTHFLSLFT